MLKTYKYPEIPDQDKPNAGFVLFGIQKSDYVEPLPFYAIGNGSAIVSFTAVKYDSKRNEISRTALSTSIIDVDLTNGIYNVDGATLLDVDLDACIYRFEFQNDSNLWKTEYFLVSESIPDNYIFEDGENYIFEDGNNYIFNN